jgi:hypothetical protein
VLAVLGGGAALGGVQAVYGSWTRAGRQADIGAVKVVLLCPVQYLAQHLGSGLATLKAPIGVALLAVTAALTAFEWRIKSNIVVPALNGAACALVPSLLAHGTTMMGEQPVWLVARRVMGRPRALPHPLLLAAAAAIGLAFAATAYDMTLRGCKLRSLCQWHACCTSSQLSTWGAQERSAQRVAAMNEAARCSGGAKNVHIHFVCRC